MGIENITYRTLVNSVVSYITANCNNIDSTKFNALPAYFKSTYINQKKFTASNGGQEYTGHIYVSVSGNAVSQVSNTVNANLVAFLNISNLDANIDTKSFIAFFNNILSFCSRYLRFATSQFDTKAYLIYGDTGNTQTFSSVADDLIRAQSVQDIITVLKNRLNVLVRCYPVRYTFSFD